MSSEFMKSVAGYKMVMAQVKKMFELGVITAEDFTIIETKMCEKYCINSVSLYRENNWINTNFRGNISPAKEV